MKELVQHQKIIPRQNFSSHNKFKVQPPNTYLKFTHTNGSSSCEFHSYCDESVDDEIPAFGVLNQTLEYTNSSVIVMQMELKRE